MNNTTFTEAAQAGATPRHRMLQMPVFKPGVRVLQGGREETVSHVVLRRKEMMVYLVGQDEPIRPDRLQLEPQWFTTERLMTGVLHKAMQCMLGLGACWAHARIFSACSGQIGL